SGNVGCRLRLHGGEGRDPREDTRGRSPHRVPSDHAQSDFRFPPLRAAGGCHLPRHVGRGRGEAHHLRRPRLPQHPAPDRALRAAEVTAIPQPNIRGRSTELSTLSLSPCAARKRSAAAIPAAFSAKRRPGVGVSLLAAERWSIRSSSATIWTRTSFIASALIAPERMSRLTKLIARNSASSDAL